MLERIILRNFQLHEKEDVELGQITTFVGPSDSGKSSFLRAFRLVCRNLPAGEAFIRHGESSCSATIVAEGRKVKRTKGSENSYRLDKETPLKVIGQGPSGIPTAVSNLLRVDDINIQLQHDPPFWFADTPGQVSKALNRIVNLDVIDRTLAKAASAVRQAQAVEEVTAARVKEAEDAVKKLEWVRGFDAALSAVISARDRHAEVDNKVGWLEALLDRYDEAVAEKKRFAFVGKTFSEVETAHDLVNHFHDQRNRLIGLLKAHKVEVERGMDQVGDFGPVEEAKVEGDRVADECGRLEWLVDQYEQAEEKLCQLRSEQKELEKRLGGRCPTCGAETKSSRSSRPTCTSAKHRR